MDSVKQLFVKSHLHTLVANANCLGFNSPIFREMAMSMMMIIRWSSLLIVISSYDCASRRQRERTLSVCKVVSSENIFIYVTFIKTFHTGLAGSCWHSRKLILKYCSEMLYTLKFMSSTYRCSFPSLMENFAGEVAQHISSIVVAGHFCGTWVARKWTRLDYMCAAHTISSLICVTHTCSLHIEYHNGWTNCVVC